MPNSCTASTPRPASGSERPTWLPVRTSLSRRRPRGSFTLICTCCGASSSRVGLLRPVAFGVVQKPLGVLRPLVVDVRRPAVQRNAAVRVLFHQAAVVINDRAVEAVYLGPGNVLDSARPTTRVIELRTISPETARELHRAALKVDVCALDIAVSGSTKSAEAGALTLFGGGDRDVFEATEAIFSAIAKQWFYMGPSGSGVAMKLVVNGLLGVGMQAIAEAAALGSRLGLPRDLLLDTLAKTAVVAPAHAGKLATAQKNDYTPQFPIRLMHKDFGLIDRK